MEKGLKDLYRYHIETPVYSKYVIEPEARMAMAVGVGKKRKQKEKKKVKKIDYVEVIDSYDGIEIVKSSEGLLPVYNVPIPKLGKGDWKQIEKYKETLLKYPPILNNSIQGRKELFAEEAQKLILGDDPSISKENLEVFVELLTNSLVGFGVIEFLLVDDMLEEIMVLGESKRCFVFHRKHGMCTTNIEFEDDEELVKIVDRMAEEVGRKITSKNPLLDARLRDGSRVNATLRDVTPGGATLTIRKFMADPLTVVDVIKNGTISIDFAAWLWLAVDGLGVKPANVIITGGTSSGKTTSLNIVATFIPEGERVISIEDTLEVQLSLHEHWVQMETRPSFTEDEKEIEMNDLLKNTLRMRPDRIIVGEVRGPEADTLFAAMNTGHDGCMGTLHANDAKETITRLTNPPMDVPMIMLPALDLIIIQSRFRHPQKGYIRRILEVTEVAGMESGKLLMNKIFTYNVRTDELVETGTPSRLMQDLSKKSGITATEIHNEIEKRAHVLRWLVENDKRSLLEVNESIVLFNRDQNLFIEKVSIS
jgi:flagellar protein FlaI